MLDLAALRQQLALDDRMSYQPRVFVLPNNGCVPDADTAITIAKAVWLPIYGPDIVSSQPFSAVLEDETWIVRGAGSEQNPAVVLVAHIAKADARIFKIGQEQG